MGILKWKRQMSFPLHWSKRCRRFALSQTYSPPNDRIGKASFSSRIINFSVNYNYVESQSTSEKRALLFCSNLLFQFYQNVSYWSGVTQGTDVTRRWFDFPEKATFRYWLSFFPYVSMKAPFVFSGIFTDPESIKVYVFCNLFIFRLLIAIFHLVNLYKQVC